jgi:hypothetical protein
MSGGDFNSIANLNTNGIARFDNLTTEIEKIPDSHQSLFIRIQRLVNLY